MILITTAGKVGSEAARLLARLSAQCARPRELGQTMLVPAA
jgi:hypothetical protein